MITISIETALLLAFVAGAILGATLRLLHLLLVVLPRGKELKHRLRHREEELRRLKLLDQEYRALMKSYCERAKIDGIDIAAVAAARLLRRNIL